MHSLTQQAHHQERAGIAALGSRTDWTRVGADGPGDRCAAPSRPIRVVLLDDFEVVLKGLSATLSSCAQFELVDLGSMRGLRSRADITLLDPFLRDRTEVNLNRILRNNGGGKLVLYSWIIDHAQAEVARGAGLWGYISKGLGSPELRDALHRIHSGERVYSDPEAAPVELCGLSQRETDVVKLILQGYSNGEIAKLLFLSGNSIKSYIRSAYQKMGVRSRSQAILWGLTNGLSPTGIRPSRPIAAFRPEMFRSAGAIRSAS